MSKNILFVKSHFQEKSFSNLIIDTIINKSHQKGNTNKIIDLYKEKFNPLYSQDDVFGQKESSNINTDIQKYQELISWADHIYIVFPLWWGQMPAILKGFCDRVLQPGFAFSFKDGVSKGLLVGKSCHIYVHYASPEEYYNQIGMNSAIKTILGTNIFEFCGFDTKVKVLGNSIMMSEEQKNKFIDSIEII